jgi:FtsP/CotA-like multicopper oxidase with cupredoxin domain
MTAVQAILLDHAATLLSAMAWFAAGVTNALRRRSSPIVLTAAVLATLVRVVTVTVVAGHGWWFVEEKVLLGLPLLGATSLAAVVLARTRPGGAVAAFTAGYAALAGLAVTMLAGYPLTWGTALVALSLVGAATLLTARVLASRDAEDGPSVSRRRFLGLAGGAVVVGAAAAGLGLSLVPRAPTSGAAGGVPVTELRGSGPPAPGGTVRRHTISAQKTAVRLSTGREIEAWTYNGQVPGPAITATRGDLIEVQLRNVDIDGGVTLHWHGYDVPCGEDGAPGTTQYAVAPGGEYTYRFRADQVGTYWYHTHQGSHEGVRKGLYGTLVVTPRDLESGLDLTLPVHTIDGTLLVADHDGSAERPVPAGTRVRLRLINTDSDPHRIALVGTPFQIAAVDGRDLNGPGEVSGVALRLPAGGRSDLAFTMPSTPVALVLDDRQAGLRLGIGGEPPADPAGWPDLDLLHYGTPAPAPFDPDQADRHFTMVLDRGVAVVDGLPSYGHTVNGRGHPSIPDQIVTRGDVVRFTVVNRSLETHPWHLHGHPVLILSRNGTRSTGSPLWVDTFDVRGGETWEVAFHATNPGVWMNHCHNLPHSHQGMMLRLRYDGITTPLDGSHTVAPTHSQ